MQLFIKWGESCLVNVTCMQRDAIITESRLFFYIFKKSLGKRRHVLVIRSRCRWRNCNAWRPALPIFIVSVMRLCNFYSTTSSGEKINETWPSNCFLQLNKTSFFARHTTLFPFQQAHRKTSNLLNCWLYACQKNVHIKIDLIKSSSILVKCWVLSGETNEWLLTNKSVGIRVDGEFSLVRWAFLRLQGVDWGGKDECHSSQQRCFQSRVSSETQNQSTKLSIRFHFSRSTLSCYSRNNDAFNLRDRNHKGNKMKAYVSLEFVSTELSFGAQRVKLR